MSRKSGYYWVMYYTNTWEPAYYENNMGWKLIGSNQCFPDSDLQEIDPSPIVREEPKERTYDEMGRPSKTDKLT